MEPIKKELTQKELFDVMERLEEEGVETVLVDTILKPLPGFPSMTLNPPEMKKMKPGTLFVFYCDTGKSTMERLPAFERQFPDHRVASLRGGRSRWRETLVSAYLSRKKD